MNKETIEAGEILISEFMGRKFYAYNGNKKYTDGFRSYKACQKAIEKFKWVGYAPQLSMTDGVGKYHESWDSLMPVVEKIKEYGKWTLEPGFASLELYRELAGYGNIESKRKRFSTSQMDWETEFDEPVKWVFLVHNIVVQFLKYSSGWELKSQVATGMHESTSLNGCPFHYCDKTPKCEDKCRYS